MAAIPQELIDLYGRYFGGNPIVTATPPAPPVNDIILPTTNQDTGYPIFSPKGAVLAEEFLGVEIWLPITLRGLDTDIRNAKNGNPGEWYLPYCTVEVTGGSSVIRTPLNQRKGQAKELYSIDDYKIDIKGFLIDKATRTFPEAEIYNLKRLFEKGTSFKIDNAITNIFLEDPTLPPDQQYRVIVLDFKLPEVTGGKKSMRPFTLSLESDYIFTLERA